MGDSVKKYYEDEDSDLYWKTSNTLNIKTMYPGDIEVTMDKSKKDSYVQIVKAKFEARSQRGIEKYNTTLEREDLNLQEWLTHLQEELMDATLYVERLKAEIGDKLR
jgi:hypothetical protein